MKTLIAASIISTCLFSACKKDLNNNTNVGNTLITKIAPEGFAYHTTKQINVTIDALTNDNKPIAAVSLNIYTLNADTLSALIYKGYTDNSGNFSISLTIPASCDTLVIDPAFIGLMRLALVPVSGNNISCTFGGTSGYAGAIIGSLAAMNTGITLSNTRSQTISSFGELSPFGYTGSTKTKFVYMGAYDSQGGPLYQESVSDIISATELQSINTSLPEHANESVLHPQWITSGSNADIVITQQSDVYLTFVYEGALYTNSLGWYKYPTGNAPVTMNNIDTIHFIYPNCSFLNSGGDLLSGEKVHIGNFPAGTTIGLVLFADGWNGKTVNYYAGGAYFTDSYMNPETVTSLQSHTVLFQYQNQYLIGFEDYNRQSSGCDNDFNDVMVYASSNPVNTISFTNAQQLLGQVDTDGDGVPDNEDAFPLDPTRAYINYFPSQNAWGTLAYEDNWPLLGDYDMNDLVVSYQYKIISNAQNNVVEFYGSFAPIASGAIYNNGFGVQFPFAASLVKTVSGQNLSSGYIKNNANGTEAGQQNAVIIPFDNARKLISNTDGNLFINTLASEPKVTGDTAVVYVQFNSPITANTLNTASFNPFLISNMRRGYEVHLPNFAPTSLAEVSLIGTQNDASIPSSGIYYVTKDNHPWGLNFIGNFQYPLETIPISQAYLHFFDWSGSGGNLFTDWYSNTAAGYQNNTNIYSK